MPRLVHRGYDSEARKPGNVVNVEIPQSATIEDVAPSNVSPNPEGSTPATVAIPVDKWKKNKPFGITDKEMTEILSSENYIPGKVSSAVAELSREQNRLIFANYKSFYGFYGTPGTTPFSADDKATDAAQVEKVLNDQLCPSGGRVLVMDPAAKAAASVNGQMSDYDKTGSSNGPRITGDMGQRHGFDCFMDQDVPLHTAGTGASIQTSAAGAVGDESITVDTGTGTLEEGDIITFAGHSQTYAVKADVADVSAGTVTFSPPLVAVVADNEAVAVKATHRVNLAFREEAFSYVTVEMEKRDTMVQVRDDLTGIVLRLEQIQQYKQTMWELDILSGSACVRPECGARLAG